MSAHTLCSARVGRRDIARRSEALGIDDVQTDIRGIGLTDDAVSKLIDVARDPRKVLRRARRQKVALHDGGVRGIRLLEVVQVGVVGQQEDDLLSAGRTEGACRFDQDRKSTRLNSSHLGISYAVFCLKKKNKAIYIILCSRL